MLVTSIFPFSPMLSNAHPNNNLHRVRNELYCNDYHQSADINWPCRESKPAMPCFQPSYVTIWATWITLHINPFLNKPWFLRVCSTSLLKTQWEKEKLLVMSNFSFPPVFSSHLENFLPFLSNLKLLSADSFSLEESKICRLGKG